MNTEVKQADVPSDRAVAIARTWLAICGVVLVAFGIGIASSLSGGERIWGIAIALLGVANFIAARYASERVAVFFASLGV